MGFGTSSARLSRTEALAGWTDVELELRRRARPALVPTFRGAALEAQTSTAHELILAGPAETGKTFGLCWRFDSLLRSTPGARAAIVRRVRQDMGATVLQTWERVAALRGMPSICGGNHPEWYDYPNGARAYVIGLDRPGAVLSGELDFVLGNQLEEFDLAAWETIVTRCTGRAGHTTTPQLLADANPGPANHWILGRPAAKVLYSYHADNPTLYDDAGVLTAQGARTMAILDSLTGVRRERLFLGRWVSAEGVVYEGFSRKLHVVPPFDVPKDWRAIVSIDFGFTNPFVAQLWRVDPDGRAYLTREIYRTQRIVEDHARDIKAMVGSLPIEAVISDHDAEDRATLERHWRKTIPAQKGISDGIQAVQARLALAADKKPRLFVVEGALVERDEALAGAHKPVCTLDEFESYSWPKGADGKALKEVPVKADDHGMDAMRYLVAHLERGHTGVRVMAVHNTARRMV